MPRIRRTVKIQRVLDELPSDGEVVRCLVERYVRGIEQATRLRNLAARTDDVRERLAVLREARGQEQTAMVALREASEHAHRGARVGTHVGRALPQWLTDSDETDAKGNH